MKTRKKIAILIILSFILILSIILFHNYIERKTDSQIKYILGMIAITLNFDNPPIINYGSYNIKDNETISCKDFAFSFVVLYNDRFGDKAKVVGSSNHAFVKIGSIILEHQQSPGSFKRDFRGENIDYNIKYHYRIREQDKEIIRKYLR